MIAVVLLAAAALSGIEAQIDEIARAAHGHVGAAAMVVETGESIEFHGAERFPMQSVYKFPIATAILNKVDRGEWKLDQTVHVTKRDLVPRSLHSPLRDQHPDGGDVSLRELLRLTVSESDGTASDVLLRLAGGPESVTRHLRSLGVNEIVVATSEGEMVREEHVQYRNWATPRGMVQLLSAFERGRGLSPGSRELLLSWMTKTDTGLHRLKGDLPANANVAHKTGTSGTNGGLTRATNDVGLITLRNGRHLAIAVFVSDSAADLNTREGVIAKIARACWNRF